MDGLDKQDRILGLDCEACGDGGPLIKEFQDHFRSKNNKDQYDYNTIIVSLYGYLERFIEDLISEHLNLLSTLVPELQGLPSVVQEKHLELSLELVRKADHHKYASNVRKEDIIARLHACFSTPDQYQLNIHAFTQHAGNFRQSVVNETFALCGISGIAQPLRQVEPFVSFLTDEDQERDIKTYLSKADDVVFSRLNDLANRRNDVAHGTPVDDIMSRDLLRTYVNFIEAYSLGLALVVYEKTLPFMKERALVLGDPIAVFDGRIVCVNFPAGQIAVGDTLIAQTQDTTRPYKGGLIKEIQRDHVPFDMVDGGPGVQIGLRVEFGAKKNQEFYYFKATR